MFRMLACFLVLWLLCTAVALSQPITREIEPSVDHNHCTTRQFQHMSFKHGGVWFVLYSDGEDFVYQTSSDGGRTWRRGAEAVCTAPNGSTSHDVLLVGDEVVMSYVHYPLGRYDVNAPYAKDPARRGEYTFEGRIKRGRIEGERIVWTEEVAPGFRADYGNLVRDAAGYFWLFSRHEGQGIVRRSLRPGEIAEWGPMVVCVPNEGRHAMDAAAMDDGKLYVASVLTTRGEMVGNLFDGNEWGVKATVLDANMTETAGDDRRLAMEFDPTVGRLHLVYVDADSRLRYRCLDRPYGEPDWRPGLGEPAELLAEEVFTCALSVDSSRSGHLSVEKGDRHLTGKPAHGDSGLRDRSQSPFSADCYELVVTYGVQKHVGRDKRQRTGELYARRLGADGRWVREPVLVSRPGTIHNWYPNVNRDVRDGLCVMYSRSVDSQELGVPLAVMVSVVGLVP